VHISLLSEIMGIQIKIGMSLAVVFYPLESKKAKFWYTFLCKKDSTIAIYEVTPYLILKDMFSHELSTFFHKLCEKFLNSSLNFLEISVPNHKSF
jgi:hypothetical protein